MLLVITGNGKGKTTSALGTAIRASGWGNRVVVAFFDKGGSHYGEQNILDLLQAQPAGEQGKIDTFRFGLKRFDESTRQFRFTNTEEDKLEAEQGVERLIKLFPQDYFLLVCDEIINCLNLGLLKEESVSKLLEACPPETHLVFTGRNVPDWLFERADLVSEVQEQKHYFKNGKDAIKGLDY